MRLSVVDSELCVGCQSCMFACARRHKQAGLEQTRIWVRSAGGMSRGFTVVVCRACPSPPCARVCPVDAIAERAEGGVTIDEEQCIGCGYCVEACPYGAIFANESTGKPLVCVYCGYCVAFCPHGVLELDRRERPPVTWERADARDAETDAVRVEEGS